MSGGIKLELIMPLEAYSWEYSTSWASRIYFFLYLTFYGGPRVLVTERAGAAIGYRISIREPEGKG